MIVSLICLSFIFMVQAAQYDVISNNEYYNLKTYSSYEWTKSYPQSCECSENGVLPTNCELFKCKCTCDITAGSCDYNCCCDPDCTSAQIERFQTLGTCLFEGYEPDTIQYCYSSSELYGVNPKSPMGGDSTSREALGRALCVEKKNYAFRDDFYTAIDTQTAQIFSQSAGQKDFSYTESNVISDDPYSVDSYYDRNDSIGAFYNNSYTDGLVNLGIGFLPIPLPDFSGYCNDANYAKFENDVPLTSCKRQLAIDESLFSTQCLTKESLTRYIFDLYIAKVSNVVPANGVVTFSQTVKVNLGNLYYQDFLTGNIDTTDISSTWNSNDCTTTFDQGTNSTDLNLNPCFLAQGTTRDQILSTSLPVCIGMVKSIFYNVNHSSSAAGSIDFVTADVIISDIPLPASNESTSFEQQYGINYISVNSADLASTNGNQVYRRRSGNPGYLLGLPLLFGYKDTSSGMIKELISGLSVPGPISDGLTHDLCPTGMNSTEQIQTSFGYDTISGCSLTLTRQQIKDFCCYGAPGSCLSSARDSTLNSSDFSSSSGLPFFLNFTTGYIGQYGDADPLDITQWMLMSSSIPTDERAWNDKTSTCYNAYTGINFKFLISYSGEKSNPQNKIVGALAEIVTSDITTNIPLGDETSTQTFQLSSIVSFVYYNDERVKGYEPPAPPALFKVPYDVFYPFLSNSAPSMKEISYVFLIPLILTTFSLYFIV